MLTKEEVGDMISNVHAPVAQLDRVLGYEPNGREFESLRVHQYRPSLTPIYLEFGWVFILQIILTMIK